MQGRVDNFRFVEGITINCFVSFFSPSLSLSLSLSLYLSAAFRLWTSLQKLNSIRFWIVISVLGEEKETTIQPLFLCFSHLQCKDGFWGIFLIFTVLMKVKAIFQTIQLQPNGRYKGDMDGKTYRTLLDRLEMDDVCWRSYEEHREIQEFEDIFWYSGWNMCGVKKVYRHFPEWVKRQYGYVQNIPRPLKNILSMWDTHIVQAFLDFHLHTIKEDSWG